MPPLSFATPGVYVEEISSLAPSIPQVETAIPAFIGYTEKAEDASGNSLSDVPTRINSLNEYEQRFGPPARATGLQVTLAEDTASGTFDITAAWNQAPPYLMHQGLQMYFNNGGGTCYIVSVGDFASGTVQRADLKRGLDATDAIDEITLYCYPDAQDIASATDFYGLYDDTLALCARLEDRFALVDVWPDPSVAASDWMDLIETLRSTLVNDPAQLRYGAAYFPNLETAIKPSPGAGAQLSATVVHTGGDGRLNGTLGALLLTDPALHARAMNALGSLQTVMPPSPAMAGLYSLVDATRGVWKAPANVSLASVIGLTVAISHTEQEILNVDAVSGKSVNAIRSFIGKGILVWGARTLAGNDNEWRHVSVQRFFTMVKESLNKGLQFAVFEPNDANTWAKVKLAVENFLGAQWRAGALTGAAPEDAFYVKVGLGETMTALDIAEGRMIVEIGMSIVRPAEFVILRIMQQLLP